MAAADARRWVLLMIAAFLVVGVASVLATPRINVFRDMATYDAIGFNLAQGRGYTSTGDAATGWRVPGYPLFLAGVYRVAGHSTLAVRLLEVIIAGATIWAAWRLSLLAFGSERAAVWAAALAAICPTTLVFAHLLMAETLFTALLALGVIAAFAWRDRRGAHYLAVGAILGIAALVRPIGAAAALSLPVALLVDRQRWAAILTRTAAAWLAFAVIMSPWWYRNWRVFNTFVPSDLTAGITFFIGNNELAAGRSDFSLAQKLLPPVKDEIARDRLARQRGLAFIRAQPGRFLRILPGKAMAFWGLDRDGLYCYREGFWGRPRGLGFAALSPTMLGIAVLLPLALMGILFSSPRQPIRWMLWPILVCWVIATLTAPQARIHAPLVPMLAVLAGRSIAERQWRSAVRWKRGGVRVVAFWAAIAILIIYWAWEVAEATLAAF